MPVVLSKPIINKYANGKIYKLENDWDEFDAIYVGSTCKLLIQRKTKHDYSAKIYPDRPVYEYFNYFGWENVKIVLLEDFPCANEEELLIREKFWIDKLKPDLNVVMIGRTRKEYYKANKEKLLQGNHEYYETNKEEVIIHQKEYYTKNKDKILDYHKEYNEKNKNKIADYQKEYKQINKVKLALKGKITTICPCGTTVRKADLIRHTKSKFHQKYLETQK